MVVSVLRLASLAQDGISAEMALVPGGTFTMGDARGRADETPHVVTITPFMMDKTPVTQGLYEQVTGVNPAKHRGRDLPAEQIQWTDAARFCNLCSARDHLTPCYNLKTWTCDFSADGYRLPTEAEWEYACRAGRTGRWGFADEATELGAHAWFKGNSGGKTHPVGGKAVNPWGLYDMPGNVWEWCTDYYGPYDGAVRADPRGPPTGRQRVLRGGAWDAPLEACRAAYRSKEFPAYTDACFGYDAYGFRRVRSPERARRVEGRGGDGEIVFVSDRAGSLGIWIMKSDGKNQRSLTHDLVPDADPRFSPDGQSILYTSLRDGFPQVRIMNRDGAGSRSITGGGQADWSPDGASIVFIRDNQAWIRELMTHRERNVTPPEWERCGTPTWAPDNHRIAVASRHTGTIGIYFIGDDGNDAFHIPEAACTPRWSKDGKSLLCQTVSGHVCRADVDGGNWEQLTSGADIQHDPRFSPDGSMIVFARAPKPEGPWQICVKRADPDDDAFVQLTTEGSNSQPDWTAGEH